MDAKATYYTNLATETADRVTKEWPSFLATAARMYKYPFHDQIMIYAQRPDATACASFDLWNNVMNRMVKRGSKGIALVDSNGGQPNLRYVFDVADTVAGRQARDIQLWDFKKEHEEPVLKALSDSYGETAEKLTDVVEAISKKLADEYLDGNINDISETIPYVTEWDFREIVTVSVNYAIRARCGVDADFPKDLQLSDLTQEGVHALGTAVSVLSEQVLRGIEIAVKQYEHERKKQNERQKRNELSSGDGRGLFNSQPDSAGGAAGEQIRTDARELSEGTPGDSIHRPAAKWEARGTSIGNQPDGGRTDGSADGRTDGKEPAPGQSDRPNGLGRPHEQPAPSGGRNHPGGTNLHLGLFDTLAPEDAIPANTPVLRVQPEPDAAPAPERKESSIAKPDETIVERLLSESGTDYYLLYHPDKFSSLSPLTLSLINDKADKYVICADVRYLSDDDMAWGNVEFRQMPYDLELLPETVQEKIAAIKPEYFNLKNFTETKNDPIPAENFHITDLNLGEGGVKTKYSYNAEAIRALKQIEAEKRHATPEEQNTLSRYVGWGGLPQAFDEDNSQWAKEYAELKDLLSPDEYNSTRASTLNAHYTSPAVIQAMYETVERMGFKRGNILEPASGIGNFFGMLPESMKAARLYGVEIDDITGRIAQKLYPNADIQIKGFEDIETSDATFDLAIGNVPFGGYGVADKRYDNHRFLIHDYFFAKTLDQVRPGGIIAFITSHGTMDKQSSDVRRYIAQRAELLGAVRLPNNAFLKNAGTEVTTDILFLQKHERVIDISPAWIHRGVLDSGVSVNSYFAEHPEMILGRMEWGDKLYGDNNRTSCQPIEGADLSEKLREALSHIEGFIKEPEIDAAPEVEDKSIPADPNVRNFSFTVVDNTVYYRENSRMHPVEDSAIAIDRLKGLVALRDCAHELIDYQLNDRSNIEILDKQAELNKLYDSFTAKHGLINSKPNSRAFSDDSAYYLLASLEIIDENGLLARKADMFTKRTISRRLVATEVDTSSEALAVSISEKARVDLQYMMELTGFAREKLIADLEGVIFRDLKNFSNIDDCPFVTADEYLSGNVREKLRQARYLAENLPRAQVVAIAPNIAALELAQPKDLDASEIAVRLGSTWVNSSYIKQFIEELLEASPRQNVEVNFCARTCEWDVSRYDGYNGVRENVTYGTSRMNAFHIIEETLNLRDVRVYDTIKNADGKKRTELNKDETTKAQQMQETIKQAFKDWIFNDAGRRQELVKTYNEKFNSTRPREYNGSHLNFVGMTPDITLRPHQLNAVAHVLYGGNTLLAHEVGAGKTFEMVAAAMESKRLDLCRKSLFTVPNHLTEQWGSEFLRLYPSANILVATAKDFETANRKKFCARIATGDYDAVIIGHSQLEKIPVSKERQERFLREQISDIINCISDVECEDGPRFTIKQLEKAKKNLETRLERLQDESRKDDVVTFEQLGCDRLFVDEAHYFKNLFLYTKMRNVAGIAQTEAQKSSALFLKCRYLDEITDGKGIIFATGTPVSNSMTEMYTMQRYLQYDALQRHNLEHFDAWASTYGETVTAIELAPEGSGYRARTRFARFYNLPELMCMFKEVADIKTADMMHLPRPDAKFHTVVVKPSEIQKEMVEKLSERAAAVHNRLVEPEIDNMLKITTDGRKIGLDQRLINPMLPDFPESKVNACMDNIYQIWKETEKDRLAQLVFCDFSTPNADGRLNVYDDIKEKLIARGVPEKEIAFIHDANTEIKKKELFAKTRQGSVRVLFGSTAKMGSGTNVQDRLIHLHDLDCPWRPADLEQRAGRIIRQGNMNPEVHITRYVTESTFDAYLYQTVENKQKFISQIMTSKSPVRACEDVDETALSYAEIKALYAGNPLIKEKMDLDIEVARLRLLKADYRSQHYRLEDAIIRTFPEAIEAAKERIAGYVQDQERLNTHTTPNKDGFSPMKVFGVTHEDKAAAGKALIDMCKTVASKDPVKIGEYRGFDLYLSFNAYDQSFTATLKGAMHYSTALGQDVFGNITRINNLLNSIPERLSKAEQNLQDIQKQLDLKQAS